MVPEASSRSASNAPTGARRGCLVLASQEVELRDARDVHVAGPEDSERLLRHPCGVGGGEPDVQVDEVGLDQLEASLHPPKRLPGSIVRRAAAGESRSILDSCASQASIFFQRVS